MSTRMAEVLSEANRVKPVMRVNGRDVYTAEDAQKLNKAELMEERATGHVELGARAVNPDGTYAACRARNVVVDPGMFLDNRYRKVGETYEVVTDLRAVKEQGTGRVYADNIIAHVIHKESGKLAVKETKAISAAEFVKEFKKKLDEKSMISIFGLIQTQDADMTSDKLVL